MQIRKELVRKHLTTSLSQAGEHTILDLDRKRY
jgi:hypothetical protein